MTDTKARNRPLTYKSSTCKPLTWSPKLSSLKRSHEKRSNRRQSSSLWLRCRLINRQTKSSWLSVAKMTTIISSHSKYKSCSKTEPVSLMTSMSCRSRRGLSSSSRCNKIRCNWWCNRINRTSSKTSSDKITTVQAVRLIQTTYVRRRCPRWTIRWWSRQITRKVLVGSYLEMCAHQEMKVSLIDYLILCNFL